MIFIFYFFIFLISHMSQWKVKNAHISNWREKGANDCPKCLCLRVNNRGLLTIVLLLLPWLSSFVSPIAILCLPSSHCFFPLYFTSHLSISISFYGTSQDPNCLKLAATFATNSTITSFWIKLKVIGVKCASNATIQSHINETNDSWDSTFSRSEKWGVPLSWLN